jgi:peptidoglycan-associated lipoprotein
MSIRHLIRGIVLYCVLLSLLSGCPAKVPRPNVVPSGPMPGQAVGPVSEQDMVTLQANLRMVYFDYDQYTLSPESQQALQYNAQILRQVPGGAIVAEGHCDERGTAEYNLALGDRRARSVVEYLSSLGVPPQRMSTVSYGSELPVDPSHNEAAWGKNRRVYLRVSR